jgi:hypothetical protein
MFQRSIGRKRVTDTWRCAPRPEFVSRKSPQDLLLATRLLPVNLTDDAKFECSFENGSDGAEPAAVRATAEVRSGTPTTAGVPQRGRSAASPGCPEAERKRIPRATSHPSDAPTDLSPFFPGNYSTHVSSKFARNLLKTKDGGHNYSTHNWPPFWRPFSDRASRFPYNPCTDFR